MNEEPKSIWKKSWTGWRGSFFGWLILMVALAAILLIWLVAEGTPINKSGDELELFVATGTGVTVIFLVATSFSWLCCWRNFKRLLFGLACMATLIALFYAEEDWRGWHAWNQFKHQWEAKGEKFDYASTVPPPVPDDQNFAFSPVWIGEEKFLFQKEPKRAEAWYGDRIYSEEVSNLLSMMPVSVSGLVGTNIWWPSTPEKSDNWATANTIDLKPWQSYYRDLEITNPAAKIPVAAQPQSPAADVLLALSKFDPVIEKLRVDSVLPYSRFPVLYDTDDPAAILIPHLAALKRYSQVLQLRALAELQDGQSEKALDDVKLALRLADSVRTEPFIITHLVRIAILNIALQPVWEGLAEHKWSDAQLAELDLELAKLDFLADYELSVRGERAAHVKIVDWMEQKRSRFWDLFNMVDNDYQKTMLNHFGLTVEIYLMPKGWYYQSEIVLSQVQQQWVLPMVNDPQQTVSPENARKSVDAVSSLRPTAVNLFARLLLPELGKYAMRAAHGQNSANMARIAIALERWRLAHGNFPDSLDALTPQFMEKVPHDIIGGQPLHYRRTDDGQFVLYSVGWNEKDDGGVVVNQKSRDPRDESGNTPDISQGDWVWRYP
jgi:hypothetical protein